MIGMSRTPHLWFGFSLGDFRNIDVAAAATVGFQSLAAAGAAAFPNPAGVPA